MTPKPRGIGPLIGAFIITLRQLRKTGLTGYGERAINRPELEKSEQTEKLANELMRFLRLRL
jgi:hypothetical protein